MEVAGQHLRPYAGITYRRLHRLFISLEIIELAKISETVKYECIIALCKRKGALKGPLRRPKWVSST
jgi:hypothetical protein